jgi:hypothetical protein
VGRSARLGGLAAAITLAACGGDDSGGSGGSGGGILLDVEATVEFEAGTEPVALAPLADGGALVGERRTGAIRQMSADGDLTEPMAQVAVQAGENDQRGLLGLAVDGDRIYSAWTRASDGHIVVAELTNDAERLVWEGPASSDRANGGHLALLQDGRLVIGIGDLQDPDQVTDPDAPNGKLLALDPAGPPNQEPTTLSEGWNNPFAFVVTRSGALWVADNAPGDDPERIGRGDRRTDRVALPGMRAPSALVELGPGRLGLCGYLDGQLTLVEIDNGQPTVGDTLAEGCRTGAVSLGDSRLAVSDGERVRILVIR